MYQRAHGACVFTPRSPPQRKERFFEIWGFPRVGRPSGCSGRTGARPAWCLDILETNGSACSTPRGAPHPAQGWRAAPTLGLGEVDALNPNGVASRPGPLTDVRREALDAIPGRAARERPDRGLQAAPGSLCRACRRLSKHMPPRSPRSDLKLADRTGKRGQPRPARLQPTAAKRPLILLCYVSERLRRCVLA
jgi:hypothetical protein